MTDRNNDLRWLETCLGLARRSADPRTKVGAVLLNSEGRLLSEGFNRMPLGIGDTVERWHDRDLKLKLVIHGEMSALLSASFVGAGPMLGATLYLACTNPAGETWGNCPCTRCTVELLEAGISKVVTLRPKKVSKWHDDARFALGLLDEAGVSYREVDL